MEITVTTVKPDGAHGTATGLRSEMGAGDTQSPLISICGCDSFYILFSGDAVSITETLVLRSWTANQHWGGLYWASRERELKTADVSYPPWPALLSF